MVLENGYVTGSLFGSGWKHVQEWPHAGPSRLQGEPEQPVGDDDEYEDVEEEIYVTLDLGPNADPMTLGTGTEYQLIGLDTPTPYLKIGNDVFRGTPQQLIGSEIITKDTRDPLNPIKHSHPPIAYTHHRISFEPVKLSAHPTEPAPPLKDRPAMFARDAEPVAKPPTTKTKGRQRSAAQLSLLSSQQADAPEQPVVPNSRGPSSPISTPAKTATQSKRGPGTGGAKSDNASRANPLSSHFEIPQHGEIAADGIPRIDGEKLVKKGRRRKYKAVADPETSEAAASSPVASSGLMPLDEPDASSQPTPSSPTDASSLPLPLPYGSAQRVLLPDAPHGYTKFGLPRRKPGPAKGRKKAATVAREAGGVMSMLTGKLPGGEEMEGQTARAMAGDEERMEVDAEENQTPAGEPDGDHDIDPALL
ncbi:hypothetical protein NliqN6_1261 [Naganishia liquefaciens]|uniref:Transcription factor TFIIIC triple barrel domain-containing protein n=1 Tax=Naganishia liquefaciens TaxID=104408 RepID=A0A8H3TRC5_9TREE|nr:hypothetical protein NliqN6_1261 [Naganishia liquefaciens]